MTSAARIVTAWTSEQGAGIVRELFTTRFSTEPQGMWCAPGRVNVIGEHVDYNGGPCLPIALPHRTYVAMTPRQDDVIRLVSAIRPGDLWQGTLDGVRPGKVSGFPAYAAGVARVLADEGHTVGGFDAAVASCVPLGAGLSSSAALECAMGVALADSFGLGFERGDAGRARLAQICRRAENEIVGAPTGGLDQAASMRSTAGHALLIDTLDDTVRQVPFQLDDEGLALLVIDTRAPHSLTDGQYGARRDACESAARVLGVDLLRRLADDGSLDSALARLTDAEQVRRVRHVVTEICRVREFTRALESGRMGDVGSLLDASHESLRADYEVTCPELDVAVAAARSAGALGARMTGGGFGGSAIALTPAERVEAVCDAVDRAFRDQGFGAPGYLVAGAGEPAGRVA